MTDRYNYLIEIFASTSMQPRMSSSELILFESFIKRSENYVEFGSGGSTCVAAKHVKTSITSIDSSETWTNNVKKYCIENNFPKSPRMVTVDVGPIGDWGYPTDNTHRNKWPNYHSEIWNDDVAADADLYLVDGRFRVACFMQIIIHCEIDSFIAIHDFSSRKHYHVVLNVAREIAVSEDMSVFQKLGGNTRQLARKILIDYKFNPD